MSFTSSSFLVFLVVFLSVWPVVRSRSGWRWAAIVAASLFFYGWWDWRFVFLLVGNGLIDFGAGAGMGRWPTRRRLLLVGSVLANVGSLFVFKYLTWSAEQVAALSGGQPWSVTRHIVLPVGISFYTFQSMSYTIDIYRGLMRPTRDVLHYFAYLSLFAQLVAGPIVRARELMPQLETSGDYTSEGRWAGLRLMVSGYFKKVVIADNVAPAVDLAFAGPAGDGGALWWCMAVMFGVQIYGDFSGYTDIARGIGRWMGYRFPPNFTHPYAAIGFRDFWTRWHISLSTWFRDYVYIPLGGSARAPFRNGFNLLATMLVSGLWHGAAWTFVIWGGLHGCLILLERLVVRWLGAVARYSLARVIGWGLTFTGVMVGWVFFRATDLSQAAAITRLMVGAPVGGLGRLAEAVPPAAAAATAVLVVSEIVALARRFSPDRPVRRVPPALEMLAVATGIVACVFLRGPSGDFIYFRF